MSHASTDPTDAGDARSAVLSRSTLMTLRRVLHAYREGWLLEERLTAAARMVVEDARRRGLPAEGMLVALKREWAALDDARHPTAPDAQSLLDCLVTLSIRTYYGAVRLTPDRLTTPPDGRGTRSAA